MRYSSLAAPYVAIVTLAGSLWFETNPPVIAHTFGILARIEKAQFMDINIYFREVALVNIPQNILQHFILRFTDCSPVAPYPLGASFTTRTSFNPSITPIIECTIKVPFSNLNGLGSMSRYSAQILICLTNIHNEFTVAEKYVTFLDTFYEMLI